MLEQLMQAITQHMQQPKADFEKNLKALLSEMIAKLDLVSRSELERQQQALQQAQHSMRDLLIHIEQLNQRIEQLQHPKN